MAQDQPDNKNRRIQEIYALESDLERLLQHGYHVVEQVTEPGDYAILDRDAAPGWGQWMYLIEVSELPDKPLEALGWSLSRPERQETAD